MTDADNCWDHYFEPVEFFAGDRTSYIAGAPVTRGETAPIEFRIPKETMKLFQSEAMPEWRRRVHGFYMKYIKVKPAIVARVDQMCQCFSEDMIAVHFRHPSHCCEQGFKYFQDYFDCIDKHMGEHTKIYLATDTQIGLAAFLFKYGNRVVYNPDIARTSMDNLLEWAFARGNGRTDSLGFIDGKGFELHNENSGVSSTRLGEDVIIDVLTITRCRLFIHTLSNLALAVSYINPALEMIIV